MSEKLNILIADDEESIRQLISVWLGQYCEVEEYSSTPSAAALIAKIGKGEVDVMILDKDCPNMDSGTIAAAKIRKVYPDFPIIVVSGNDRLDSGMLLETEAKKFGYGVLHKPFGVEALKNLLAHVGTITK